MPDLTFEVIGAEVAAFAAIPTLLFKLRIVNADEQEPIDSVALRCQLQIAVTRRHYNTTARVRLVEIFGAPERWNETMRSLLWTHISATIPQFTGSTTIQLPVPCTYDFEIATTKYFHALEDGDIPLTFLFSGTIFYENFQGMLRVAQIPWSKEASYSLPVTLWQTMIEHYYPNSTWLRLHRDVFDQLYQYKIRHGLPTWEETLTRLLQASGEEVSR
jgi:hypothetical protein